MEARIEEPEYMETDENLTAGTCPEPVFPRGISLYPVSSCLSKWTKPGAK